MPSNPVRRQGPADHRDRGRRSGDVLRAEAAVQRTLRRRPQQARGAVEHASEGRGATRAITRVPLGKADIVRAGQRRSPSSPTARWCSSRAAAAAARASTPRSSICARSCRSMSIRSAASVKKTGRCVVAHEATRFSGFGAEILSIDPGGMLLGSGSADPARRRLGHALPACLRVGVFPGPGAGRGGAQEPSWSPHEPATSSRCRIWAKARSMPRSSPGTPSRATGHRRSAHRRGDDRQGGGRSARTGQRPGGVDHRRAGRQGRGRLAAHRVRDRCRRAGARPPAAAPRRPPSPPAGGRPPRPASRAPPAAALGGARGPGHGLARQSAPRARGGHRSRDAWRAPVPGGRIVRSDLEAAPRAEPRGATEPRPAAAAARPREPTENQSHRRAPR